MNEIPYTLVKISGLENSNETQGKKIGLLISLNWKLVEKESWQGQEIGIPITIHHRVFSHEAYIRAVCDLLSAHNFDSVEFIVAGTLQRYNLVTLNNQSIDDPVAMGLATQKLSRLEKEYIKKYEKIAREFLLNKKVKFVTWEMIIRQNDFLKKEQDFRKIRQENSIIKDEFEQEALSFSKRQGKLLSKITPPLAAYLDEEVTALVEVLLKGRLDYLVYSNSFKIISELLKLKSDGYGQFFHTQICYKTKNQIAESYLSRRKNQKLGLSPMKYSWGIECGRQVIITALQKLLFLESRKSENNELCEK